MYTVREKEICLNGHGRNMAADLWNDCHTLAQKLQTHPHDITSLARRFYRIALEVGFQKVPEGMRSFHIACGTPAALAPSPATPTTQTTQTMQNAQNVPHPLTNQNHYSTGTVAGLRGNIFDGMSSATSSNSLIIDVGDPIRCGFESKRALTEPYLIQILRFCFTDLPEDKFPNRIVAGVDIISTLRQFTSTAERAIAPSIRKSTQIYEADFGELMIEAGRDVPADAIRFYHDDKLIATYNE